jgi:hypothetical protein
VTALGALAGAFAPETGIPALRLPLGGGTRAPFVTEIAAVLYPHVYCTGGAPVPDPWTDAAGADTLLRAQLRAVLGVRATDAPAGVYAAGGPEVPLDTPSVRFYANLADSALPHFAARAVAVLDVLGVPFTVKCVPTPSWRTDRLVVYVPRDAYHDVLRALRPLTAGPGFRPAVPLCARRLGPGWATAEDPTGQLSFGQDRCLLIAETLWTAASRHAYTPGAMVDVAEEVFARRGVSLDAPHLARFAVTDYTRPVADGARSPSAPAGDRSHLDTAVRLARALAATAVWSGDRCTWLDAELGTPDARAPAVIRPTGPDLYAGVAGIALALAGVAAVTGDRTITLAATGAAWQAVARAEEVAPLHRLGYFAGWAGIGVAVAEVGRRLGDEDLLDAGVRLVRGLSGTRPSPGASRDLVSGTAGAVLAVACFPELRHDPAVSRWATDLAALLVAGQSDPSSGPSAGIAHGPEGEALALLELGAATGDATLVQLGAAGAERLASAPNGDSVSWCRGVTGSALLQLRVYRHLGGATRRIRAAAAIGTALRASSAESTPDLTLCHGLGGVADVALVAAAVLGDPALRSASEASVASVQLPRHGAPLAEIRARHGFQTAGLLLGLAGWTVLHLRLHDPEAATTPFLPAAVEPSGPYRSADVDR